MIFSGCINIGLLAPSTFPRKRKGQGKGTDLQEMIMAAAGIHKFFGSGKKVFFSKQVKIMKRMFIWLNLCDT